MFESELARTCQHTRAEASAGAAQTASARQATLPGSSADPAQASAGAAGGSGNTAAPAPGGAAAAYEVTIEPARSQLQVGSRRCDLRLGMDLSADITTRSETVLQFLLRKIRLITSW